MSQIETKADTTATAKPAAQVQTAVMAQQNVKGPAKKKAGPLVYCGPTVKGVAKQFTVYTNGLPATLEKYMEEHPAAKALTVTMDRFATVRENLRKAGTAEAILFEKLMKG